MDRPGIIWIAVAVAAIVFLDLLFVEVRRAVREAKRIVSRVRAYTELPLFSLIAASEYDVERLTTALETLPELIERARRALVVIRSPFVRRTPATDYLPKGSSPG
jgi:hypothetical protein